MVYWYFVDIILIKIKVKPVYLKDRIFVRTLNLADGQNSGQNMDGGSP